MQDTQFDRPANVVEIDRMLEKLGIKEQVGSVLANGWNVAEVRDLICWLDWRKSELVVVAHFRSKQHPLFKGKSDFAWREAVFSAMGDRSFGPVGFPPLEQDLAKVLRKFALQQG